MRRFLYDTAVFVYALGREHPYREPCRRIVGLATRGHLNGEASVDLVQEFLHVRARTGDRQRALEEARAVARLCRLHPCTEADTRRSWSLFAASARLQARDAVYAAIALNRGIEAILTSDRAFDDVPGLERIDPVDVDRLDA